jgi:hypothetical protein
MQLYIVTSLALEQNPVGNILVAKCRCHAICTTRARADALAEKYDGEVTEFTADADSHGRIVWRWENPGFASG